MLCDVTEAEFDKEQRHTHQGSRLQSVCTPCALGTLRDIERLIFFCAEV